MIYSNLIKRIIPFFTAVALGLLAYCLISTAFYKQAKIIDSKPFKTAKKDTSRSKRQFVGQGRGYGEGSGIGGGEGRPMENEDSGSASLRVLSKAKANYTSVAKEKDIQGKVLLRVTFLSNGSIGSVTPIKRLPYGLTEKAIQAARKIRFKPAMRNGKPYTVVKRVQYTFTIHNERI